MDSSLFKRKGCAIVVTVITIVILWYVAALLMNGKQLIDTYERQNKSWTYQQIIEGAYDVKRPKLPPPHQVVEQWYKFVFDTKLTSKRSLVYHSVITLQSTLLGFALGALLGIAIAIGIVHNKTLEMSFMPWVIASQTIPILAIAPIIVVVLGAVNITGIVPKALISMYLSFFPVAISMVKGLRSSDPLHLELLRTYNATPTQLFWTLRWYSAQPYLFSSLKIAIAASLVGAVVAELPTGAQGGLGARLLSGSYYGQTTLIWATLLMAALLGYGLVSLISAWEKRVLKHRGQKI